MSIGRDMMLRALRTAEPAAVSGDTGIIVPGKAEVWVHVIGGITEACLGILFGYGGFVQETSPHIAAWLLAVFCLFSGGLNVKFAAPFLASVHAVRWTGEMIEGPSKLSGPVFGMLGLDRTTIAWSDLVRTGWTHCHWYVEAHDGRRVYWSDIYNGHGVLTAVLRLHCPSLELPFDIDG